MVTNLKKAWIVNNLARMVDGEYCFNFVEYASFDKAKAEEHYNSVKPQLVKTITTPQGSFECVVERGIIEIDIED